MATSTRKPSSRDPVYTPGTARGAKLAALLIDEGTALVRKIFEDEVQKMNPSSLREQLKNHKGHLRGLRYLNPGQKKTLYPANSDIPDTAQGFDISLLELLLKELCQKAPYSVPRNRLRQFRNDNYGHIASTELSEEDFRKLWNELSDILVALGGDRDKISERLGRSIDPEQEVKYFSLLEQLYKEDMELKDLLLAQGVSLQKGQDELSAQGVSLRQGQDQMKGLLEQVLDNQREDTISKVQISSCNAEQLQQGPSGAADEAIACLKDLYATEYAHVRPLPWCEDFSLPLGEVYTNLQLQHRDSRGRFQDTDTIVSLADIYNTIATEGEESQVNLSSAEKKVRVEGDPGIGKSCSCQKLAYDWSCGKLDRFRAVFFLEMRHLAGKVKDEIFEQLLPKDTKTTPDQLWSYIQQNQDDVLFILDGLDELCQAARQVTDVVDLIQGKILRNCHVLVTSRPYHCVKDLEKCHQFYRIVGFSKENSKEFIRKYFCESPESASKLVEQLHSNKNLEEIVVNPLNNMLICVVWEENNKQLPSSESELYERIVHSVAKTHCTRIDLSEGDELPSDIEAALRGLEKLSWEGLEQEQLQFNIAEITKRYGTNADNMLNMGLLTRDYSFSRIKRTHLCAFLHKTFQEYMATRYISGLFTDGSSGEEGMKCARHLFGMSDTTVVNRELIISCHREYRKVQNWLLLILGENSRPLFDMLAEELSKTQTDEDRELLSFLCIMWLGTTCVGGGMAEIVAPCLSDCVTNNLGDFIDPYFLLDETGEHLSRPQELTIYHDDHANWCVGLAHVLAFQKKLSVRNGTGFIQHLTVHCGHVDVAQQEKLAVLESTLSDCDTIRSVTLFEIGYESETKFSTFSPLRTFIPRCGTESVIIRNYTGMLHLSMLSTLAQLSAVSTIEHVEIAAQCVIAGVACYSGERDADFSEYDRMLARLIKSHSRLRSIRFKIGSWIRTDQKNRGFGNLTATLQSISEHTRLEVVDFELPGNDALHVQILEEGTYWDPEFKTHETFNVEPMVHKLTECIKKNKILKTLRLTWTNGGFLCKSSTIYHGDCSTQSLSSLCSAIQRNRTLETLVVEGMLSHSKRKAKVISELIRTKPTSSNYEELRITMFDGLSFHEQNSIQEKILTEGILEIRTFSVARPENTSVKFVNCLFTGKSLNKETLSTQPSVLFSRRSGDRLSPSSGQF